jgi:hypothetical protein
MSQIEIVEALKGLTAGERLAVVEAALQLLREDIEPPEPAITPEPTITFEERSKQMAAAAESLRWYYENDPELTAFTALDGEDFYDYEEERSLVGQPGPNNRGGDQKDPASRHSER